MSTELFFLLLLVLHLLVSLVFFLLIKLGLLRISAQLFFLVLLVPAWGAAIALAAEWYFKNAGEHAA